MATGGGADTVDRLDKLARGVNGSPSPLHDTRGEMSERFDKLTVLRLLGELDRRDRHRRVFGAGAHQYKLNSPLLVSVVEAFEERHGVSLPQDYRCFITEIGNGGAGPYYGVLPFGRDDDDRDWEPGG